MPHALVPLIWQNKRYLFGLLFDASAATLLEVAADPARLGAEIGFLSILHTWGQTLQRHPHVHCVVPGGGLSPDHSRWIRSAPHFFLPVRVLSRVFRGKFVAGLRRAFQRKQLVFLGQCQSLAKKKAFAAFLRTLFREDWVVYAKAPFGGPEHVLQYLARYTHRVAISNHRLLSVDSDHVTFRWKDYAHHGTCRAMTLTLEEFLRRFLQHVLPKGLPRIRYFGWLANRRRGELPPPRSSKNKSTRSISLIAPNEAVHLTKTMRASACARYVCLAVDNYRYNRLGKASTRHLRPVTNRLCRIPLNKPSPLTRLRRPHQHSKPIA